MKKTRVTETQIVSVLKRQESGIATKDAGREHGISEVTFCSWKSRYGGMEVSDVKRLKDLEDEKARLKKMYAEPGLQYFKGRDLKRLGPCKQKQLTEYISKEDRLPVISACRLTEAYKVAVRLQQQER